MRPFLLAFLLCTGPSAQAVLTVTVTDIRNEACGNATGQVTVAAYGGVPPYSYVWSPNPPMGQGTPSIAGLSAGAYQVTVTDASSATASTTGTVLSDPSVSAVLGMDGASCPGMCNGTMTIWVVNGVAPISYAQMPVQIQGANQATFQEGWCNGQLATISFVDATGCPGTASAMVYTPQPTALTVSSIVGACGGANGSAVVYPNGDQQSNWPCYVTVVRGVGTGPTVGQGGFTGSGGFISLVNQLPGTYTVVRTWGGSCDADTLYFDIPDLGGNCGVVTGEQYLDHDADCTRDASDEGVPYRVLTIQPGPHYAITNTDGSFATNLPPGSYTLDQGSGVDLLPLCPATDPAPFTVSNGGTTVLDLADSSLVPLDVAIDLVSGPARPGFQQQVVLRARNLSGQQAAPIEVALTFDPALTFVSAAPSPTSVIGNVITWSAPASLTAFGEVAFTVQLQVPANPGLIGTNVTHEATVMQAFSEVTLLNNTEQSSIVVTGSYDPNDKTVRTSTGWSDDTYIIGTDEWLEYVVRFQNTGTDTAFTVVVTDTLDTDLDLGTYEQGVASHPFTVNFKPGRVVEWRFANILLPDSNTNEPLSHGLVSFRIRPAQPVLPGMEYRNNADIFFDFNPPIRTNDAVATAETSTLVKEQGQERLQVWPNPVQDVLAFSVSGAIGPYTVDVIGADGRVWMRGMKHDARLDLPALPPGAYALRVNGMVARFVKQ